MCFYVYLINLLVIWWNDFRVSPITSGLPWLPPVGRCGQFPGPVGNWIYQVHNADTQPELQHARADLLWWCEWAWWLLRHVLADAVWPGCSGAGPGLATATAQLHGSHRGHHSGEPLRPRHAKHQGAGQETDQECMPSKLKGGRGNTEIICFQLVFPGEELHLKMHITFGNFIYSATVYNYKYATCVFVDGWTTCIV